MADDAKKREEKEHKRKKQYKRMSKILEAAWQFDDADCSFQEGGDWSLSNVGAKLDSKDYRVGRHGWEDFAHDLGAVYHGHLQRKSKHATQAAEQLEKVKEKLGHVDQSLAEAASEYVKPSKNGDRGGSKSKKRKAEAESPGSHKKKHHSNKNRDLAAREERALEQLRNFIEEKGGRRSQVAAFTSRVTKKGSGNNKFDVIFHNEEGRRFRSMLEVGRFLQLVHDGGSKRRRPAKASNKAQEAEKKKIRKELERLRKAHQRATKALDDFGTANAETNYPIDDRVLMEEEQGSDQMDTSMGSQSAPVVTSTTCAAARIPDFSNFPGMPEHCTPDILMTWDFLCTFERALSLTPVALDDFVAALTYTPPTQGVADDMMGPPVYLAEAHLGLLKLLFADKSSDEYWWSVLETDETEFGKAVEFEEVKEEGVSKPVIKFDIAAALDEAEDPLITNSWLRALEHGADTGNTVKNAIKAALKVVSNKYVAAYLRKALDICKNSGSQTAGRAVKWLVDCFREARPDLVDRGANTDAVLEAKAKVVQEATKEMEGLASSVPIVKEEDIVSDSEEEESDDEESDNEEEDLTKKDTRDESERPASILPPKPLPTLIDLLLPPEKPQSNSDFVDAFTWSHLAGATAFRVLHRKKRLWNEVDDSIRQANVLPPLVVSERRGREAKAASRVLTECAESTSGESPSPVEKAIEHLCSGGNYLDLSPVEKLCLLRVLIEAAYDTVRLYDVVSGNHKQWTSAMKALEVEQRRAKREAKEKAAADEAAAREQLAQEAKDAFLDEKRDMIRQLNEKSKEFSDEIIESLTEEDIIDFDDDIKADFEALPTPESFSKTEVTKMVVRMQEEAAFDADALRVLTMDELLDREKRELESLEGQLAGLGGEEALLDESLDRETVRSIERLQRDISRARNQTERLPELREKALDQLNDAIVDGTIKVLRTAFTAAKKAKLTGPDDETGGVWAVDLMRDAALELEKAKQNKRVLDAQKDLVGKRNKCFIRNDPLGHDRFGNRFWTFDNDEDGHIWAETELALKDCSGGPTVKPPPGFLDLARDPQSISIGAKDMEEDLVPLDERMKIEDFRLFSRREYHSAGFAPALAKHHWGCHATEESLRAVIKSLDSRGVRENELKTHLKESLETVATDEKHDAANTAGAEAEEVDPVQEHEETDGAAIKTSGDEAVFLEAKDAAQHLDDDDKEAFRSLTTGIGVNVRVRQELRKDPPSARYENGTVDGWKIRRDKEETNEGSGDMELEENEGLVKIVETPIWRVQSERGHTFWLTGAELLDSISRLILWEKGAGYFENDAEFLFYRNSAGKYCGNKADAPYSSSPLNFGKLMVKSENDLYLKLRLRAYDNSWGGQNGRRALWTNSMKDYAFDFETVRQGLITLETAFFELTLGFSEYANASNEEVDQVDVEALLSDPATRVEIELESIEKNIPGLWNSPSARAVFLHIVSNAKTIGVLALALNLLCRNTVKYLQRHRILNIKSGNGSVSTVSSRTTRRMNAWQQQQQQQQEWY